MVICQLHEAAWRLYVSCMRMDDVYLSDMRQDDDYLSVT